MHDYASLFTNFRGGAGRQTFYLFDKLKKVLIIFIMAFLYDYPLVQTTILTVIGWMSAATTFVASPCQYLIPLTLFFTIPPLASLTYLRVPAPACCRPPLPSYSLYSLSPSPDTNFLSGSRRHGWEKSSGKKMIV